MINDKKINIDKIVIHWKKMSDNDFDAMMDLYKSKRFNWSLFIGHLVIEKLLKACYVQINKQHAPFTHNLLKLAINSNIQINDEKQLILDTINTFNLNARYDDYKQSFYKKCTPEYTEKWINEIIDIRTWIKKKLIELQKNM